MSVVIATNCVGARLVACDPASRAVIADALSFDVEGAEFTAGFRLGAWNGKRTFLRSDDTFEAGFVDTIRGALRERGVPCSVLDMRPAVEASSLGLDLLGVTPRDYQVETVKRFLEVERGVARIATGGGKTEVAAMITKHLNVTTLFLTHKIDLVQQTAERFRKRLGRKIGVIGEGEWKPLRITVASVQTIGAAWEPWWRVEGRGRAKAGSLALTAMAKTVRAPGQGDAVAAARSLGIVQVDKVDLLRDEGAKVDSFLRSVHLLVCDEAHRVSGDTFFRVAAACHNARWRLGLTATPGMKASREENLRLVAVCGEVVCSIGNKRLIDAGHVAEPHFRFVHAPTPPSVRPHTRYQTAYEHGVVRNQLRNALVAEAVERLVREGRKPVCLVAREAHGAILSGMLASIGVAAPFVSGRTGGSRKAAARRGALDALRDGRIGAIIASTIFDEGLDEPSVDAIVTAGGLRSRIAVLQRTGRATRRKAGDNRAWVVDFLDLGNRHLRTHSLERYKAVRDEEGWIIDEVTPWDPRTEAGLRKRFGLRDEPAKAA